MLRGLILRLLLDGPAIPSRCCEVYAACLHGQDVIARKQVEDFFGYSAQ